MSPASRRSETLDLLGLAQRAGAVVRGTEAVRNALRAGRVHLVVTAGDASPGQLGKIEGLLLKRGIPRIVSESRTRLGAALGAPPLSAAGVTDKGWAVRLQREPNASAGPD
jgi:ribosomal protein L7Ae-like RNA K-turn-binding protein